MNCDTYIFGHLSGTFSAFPDDSAMKIFKKTAKYSKSESLLIIHRSNSLVFYAYIRRLAKADEYIGLGIVINSAMYAHPYALFAMFENVIAESVIEGDIIHLAENGNMAPVLSSLFDDQNKAQRVRSRLQRSIDTIKGDIVELPTLNFGAKYASDEYVDAEEINDKIDELLTQQSYIIVNKDNNNDTPQLKSYRATLRNLYEAKKTLELENIKLKREKRQYRKLSLAIIVVVILLFVVGIVISNLNKTKDDLSETQSELNNTQISLSQANETITARNTTIDSLNNSINALHEQIHSKEQELTKAKNTINALNVKVRDLKDELSWYRYNY